MIKTSPRQSGSAHVVIIVILVVILVGALGFVFWKNYLNKENTKKVETGIPVKREDAPKPVTYKTYQTDTYPMSFKYPDSWTLENARVDNNYGFHRSIDVRTGKGNVVSFFTGGQGIGGLCGGPDIPVRSTIDVTPTTFQTPEPTTLSFTVTPDANGGYDATYGLTDTYTKVAETRTCNNTFYYLFSTGDEHFILTGFSGQKHFADLDEAKKFIASDEYAAIKKMILSLSY